MAMFESVEDERPLYQRHKFFFLVVAAFLAAGLLDYLMYLLALTSPGLKPVVADVRFALPIAAGALVTVLMVWGDEGPPAAPLARLARVFGIVLLLCVGIHGLGRIYPVIRPALHWIDGLVFAAAGDWEQRRARRAQGLEVESS